MQLPRVGPRAFLRLSQASLALVVLNIVSGAAVRLTDSGLGCPDWPTCAGRSLTPALSFHPAVEFGNRMVVVAVTVLLAVTLLAALRRSPVRRDLVWLSGALVVGVVGEAVLGGIVVYTKLNPYAVMSHFVLGMALLTVAVQLALRAGRAAGPGRALVDPLGRRAATLFLGLLALAIAAGTATTGAGPHAGGKGAVRLPVPLDDMARTHSSIVVVAVVVLLAELALLYRAGAPEAVQERGRLLLAALAAQGVIGYSQFFLHLPALLVGIHVLGATVVWSAALWFADGLRARAAEEAAVVRSSSPADDTVLAAGADPGVVTAAAEQPALSGR
ncbi:MAG: COX15/CtaA family protein [Acidobacteriota bacterium]|nr:COX15/CtaA family protein [Acidobacteriota bacterium]